MNIIWRVIIAVVSVVFVIAIAPPFARVVGFSLDGDVWLILRLCVAALAVFYVLTGFKWPAIPPKG